MKKGRMIPVVIILLLALSKPTFAPIFGTFPGLDKLISRSDAILVVDLLKQKSLSPWGLHEDYEVYVRKVIKGKITQDKKVILSLRFLPFVSLLKSESNIRWGFRIGERHIVFLSKNNEPDKALYSSLNYSGGHMQVSPQNNLSKLKGDEPKEIISQLLKDFLEYKRQELETLVHQVKLILGKE